MLAPGSVCDDFHQQVLGQFGMGRDCRTGGEVEQVLVRAAVAAREKLLADTDETLNELTKRTTKSKGRLTALMRLSYLAPDIIADILAGRQPSELSVKRLLRTSQDLPLDWPGQRAFLGLA